MKLNFIAFHGTKIDFMTTALSVHPWKKHFRSRSCCSALKTLNKNRAVWIQPLMFDKGDLHYGAACTMFVKMKRTRERRSRRNTVIIACQWHESTFKGYHVIPNRTDIFLAYWVHSLGIHQTMMLRFWNTVCLTTNKKYWIGFMMMMCWYWIAV